MIEHEKTELGKFADAAALYKAYRSLEAEFTKRCTEIKTQREAARILTEENAALRKKLENILFDAEFLEKAAADEQIKACVIHNYLSSLGSSVCPPVLKGNSGFFAGAKLKKPKTLEEARRLAEKLGL